MISRDTYIELTKFGIVGGLCFGLDLGLYYLLTEAFATPTFVGKSVSVVLATMLNYYLNKTWTWGKSDRNNRRFAKYMLLYATSGLLNVLSNELFLRTLPVQEFQMFIADPVVNIKEPFLTFKLNKFIAVVGATLVGMMVNFTGQKLWVFSEGKSTVKDIMDE